MSDRRKDLPNGYLPVKEGDVVPPGVLAWKLDPKWDEWRMELITHNFTIPGGYICYAHLPTPSREEW